MFPVFNLSMQAFGGLLIAMTVLAVVVFCALFFVDAGYGMFRSGKWGISVSNRSGWVVMEAPAVVVMVWMWLASPRCSMPVPATFAALFLTHYVQRTFIFPFLIKGRGRMPVAVIAMGFVFNTINAFMLAAWIFYLSPEGLYSTAWFGTPQFIAGTVIFIAGMAVNLHSDHIIRHLRHDGDSNHYIPYGGMFRWVSSANYFGECVEWVGFAVLTWSWAGAVFALWTFANLAPRAVSIRRHYESLFGEQFSRLRRKAIIPFIF